MTSEPAELVNLVVRWGDQSRLKCPNCTCYLAFPQGMTIAKCSRCGHRFEYVEGDLFRPLGQVSDGVASDEDDSG